MLSALTTARRRSRNGTGLSSVLVAITGDPADGPAVKLAYEMLSPKSGRLYLLHVIELERGIPLDAEVVPATAKGEDVLRHVEDIARGYKCKVETELLQSRQAGSAVVQEAVDKDVDAIVLGIPYLEKYGSFSMGESAPYILKNAPCRVVLWRDVPQASGTADAQAG